MNVTLNEFKGALDRYADQHHYAVDFEELMLVTGAELLFTTEIADLVSFSKLYDVLFYIGVDENNIIVIGFSKIRVFDDDLPF